MLIVIGNLRITPEQRTEQQEVAVALAAIFNLNQLIQLIETAKHRNVLNIALTTPSLTHLLAEKQFKLHVSSLKA